MHKTNQAIQAGYAAFQRGDFAEARRRLRRVKHPKAVHLLGLVEKADGNLREAMQLLRRAAALDSRDPEIANNLGRTAQELGDLDTAESEFRRALKIQPDLRPAMVGLGHLLVKLERWPEAHDLLAQLLPASPNDPPLRHGFAMTLLGMGQPEKAEPIFTALIEEGNSAPQIRYMRARARLELGIVDPAIDDLRAAYASKPSVLTLQSLAGMYWMTGDHASLETLVQEAIAVPELTAKAAEILRQTGSPEKALAAIHAARARQELPPASWAVEATVFIDMNDGAQAEEAARKCLAVDPQNIVVRRGLITSLLMQGKASDAMPVIEDMRKREPDDQQWLAYETTALRLLGDRRYDNIVDIERFVRPFHLPVPEGFDNIESFNSAFLRSLERWHRYETHPLDQSLRGGSQTPRDLTTINDPVIEAFYRALDETHSPLHERCRQWAGSPADRSQHRQLPDRRRLVSKAARWRQAREPRSPRRLDQLRVLRVRTRRNQVRLGPLRLDQICRATVRDQSAHTPGEMDSARGRHAGPVPIVLVARHRTDP